MEKPNRPFKLREDWTLWWLEIHTGPYKYVHQISAPTLKSTSDCIKTPSFKITLIPPGCSPLWLDAQNRHKIPKFHLLNQQGFVPDSSWLVFKEQVQSSIEIYSNFLLFWSVPLNIYPSSYMTTSGAPILELKQWKTSLKRRVDKNTPKENA